MKFKFWLIGMAVGMTVLPLGAVYAYSTEVIVKAQTKDDFSAMVVAVHQQMAAGGRYEFIDSSERHDVNARFGDMQSLFDKYGAVGQMDADTKAKLFEDQEAINAILTHRDDKRLVCKSERPIGSLLPKRTCRSYGDIERDRQKSEQFMQQQARPGLTPGGH